MSLEFSNTSTEKLKQALKYCVRFVFKTKLLSLEALQNVTQFTNDQSIVLMISSVNIPILPISIDYFKIVTNNI